MMYGPHYVLPDDDGFRGERLDAYLAMGYYRMYHLLFTTNETQTDLEGDALPVFWLRMLVNRKVVGGTELGIRKRCAGFSVAYKRAVITAEVEALYGLYYAGVDFFTSATCSGCMVDERMGNPFDSWMIEVRDGEVLIAVGYFDVGSNAMMGILNFYNPAYKKYSLGKLLMLLKMDFALANGIEFYYTGYLSTANTKFDYKLFPDAAAIEVFLPIEKQWVSYHLVNKEMLAAYYIAKVFPG